MKSNLKFEWLKFKKSKNLAIVLMTFIGLFGLFTMNEFSRQREAIDTQDYYYDKLLSDTERELETLKENETLFTQRHDSDPEIESLPNYTKLEIEYLEHILPYIEDVVDAYKERDYLAFYKAQLSYISEQTKREDYIYAVDVDSSLEEMEPRFDAESSLEYALMNTFLSADEPLELETASTANLNFVVQMLQLFRQPSFLAIIVIICNLLLIEEISDGSLSFMLLESKSRRKWFGTSSLLIVLLFLGLVLISGVVAYIVAQTLGEPVFIDAPSWYSPVTYRNEIITDTHLGSYLMLNILTLLGLFIFLHVVYRWLVFHWNNHCSLVFLFLY